MAHIIASLWYGQAAFIVNPKWEKKQDLQAGKSFGKFGEIPQLARSKRKKTRNQDMNPKRWF